MSDFFIGEALVFVLLLPVLLRPFVRKLQKLNNIPLLALVAVPLCLGTSLTGTRLLFLPLALFTLLVFLSQLARIVSIVRGLPTDYFGVGIQIFYALLLPVFAALIVASVLYMPEEPYLSDKALHFGTTREKRSAGFRYDFFVASASDSLAKTENQRFWEGVLHMADSGAGETDGTSDSGTRFRSESGTTPVVLCFPGFPAGRTGRDTLTAILAEQGFTAVGVQWQGRNVYAQAYMNNRQIRNLYEILLTVAAAHIPSEADAARAQFAANQRTAIRAVIRDAVDFAAQEFGPQRHLYAVAEGYACAALADFVDANPGVFTGSVYLLDESERESFAEPETGCAYLSGIATPMPSGAATLPGLVISGTRETGFGFGETAAEDPALAAVLGLPRDTERKNARMTAQRVAAWLRLRHPL